MKIKLDDDFLAIAKEIVEEKKSIEEWSKIESDDMFEKGAFAGGFDATENEFCFSYESLNGEYWFQLSLATIEDVAKGIVLETKARPAD